VDAWTYVLALASDRAIDEPAALGVLTESGELRALQEAVGTLNSALDVLRADRQKLSGALTTANQDRAGLRAAVVQLQGELRETERWLRQLEGSRSWRITRPIRAAGAAFRKLSQWRTASPRRGA
jgi:hypothetical protein